MRINHKFNDYEFVEGTRFEGLIPKVMEAAGDDVCTGESEVLVEAFDPTANGSDAMKVLSSQLLATVDFEGGDEPDPEPEPTPDPDPEPTPDPEPEPEPEPTPDPEPEPEPEHDFTRPEATTNTEEQDATANAIVEEALAATKSVKIQISSAETLNNITIPEESSQFIYITGTCTNGMTVTNKSSKGISITNSGDEPVDIVIDSVGSVYLGGKFNNVWTNKGISTASDSKAEYFGTITVDENYEGNISFGGLFHDGAMIQTMTEGTLSVSNNNGDDTPNVEFYAPNGDVSITSKWNEVTATVKEDTLFMKANSHVNKLTMLQGNVKVYGLYTDKFVGELIGEGTVIEPMSWNVPEDATVNKMVNNPGIYNLTEDYSGTSTLGFGLFATGDYQYNLNGHKIETTNKNYALFLRGNATVNFYGDGRFANTGEGYGLWVSSNDATLNIYGGEFEGKTHTLYSEKGTINVYGGTFKLSNADSADRDANGNLKFLVNCFDANYTSGVAKINIYGGKFYEFNPAVSYSEPNGPVSFVAEGYHVEESVEDGKKVYTVVKD